MATKSKIGGLNGMHTAGIFSDMTVDGPEIGTLVVIVDRAKNLPNRKTIGKQDPYCAARLGKEAKKTETDRRGGQTPRWDQELRFTVHDSPDYYQLKVSVFNDDKKTDLIGETWVNLQEVVVPGGGQSDIWHTLNCKGKYAGEIRIEMTYYDTRPKEEKAAEKFKQASSNAAEDGPIESLKGPRQLQQKSPVKRRPLPSDPVTGAPPALAASIPISVPDHNQKMQRGYSQPQSSVPDHVQGPVRGYSAPSAVPTHVQTPARGQQSYIPNQSPLQNVEYNTPPHQQYAQPDPKYAQSEPKYSQTEPRYSESRYNQPEPPYSQPQQYESPRNPKEYSSIPRAITPLASSPPENRYGYDSRRNDHSDGDSRQRYEEEEERFDPYHYNSHNAPYELPQPDDFGSPPSPGGPPPPPPVHRSRHGSAQPSPVPPLSSHSSYGFSDARQNPQYDHPNHDNHRHSMPDYQRQNYQPFRSPTRPDQPPISPHDDFQESPPRHHSYDSRYDHHDYNSMQPTVEDAPSSPSVRDFGTSPSYRNSQHQQYGDNRYDKVPSPAPLNLSGRGSATSGRDSTSTGPTHQYSNSSMNYTSSEPHSYRDRANTETTLSSRTSYNPLPQHNQPIRRMSEDPPRSSYNLPPVPSSLVAGMDPVMAQDISDRIYEEKRSSYSRPSGQSPRGTYPNSPHYQQNKPHPLSYQEPAGPHYDAAPVSPYDDRPGRFATAQTAVVKPRAISPDPRRPIRKSVSPSPGPPPGDESRRLSGVPFGPDSYNALNPTIVSSVSTQSLSAKYDTKEIDPDAKIITHDGREIDPSDHIPESNYAPLHEVRGPKYASQLPDRNYRRPPSAAAQGNSNAGRRPLRQAGRPQSMAASSPIYPSQNATDPSTPPNRNRLQKKSNRISAQPAPYSSPLAPITPHQDNSYTPRSQGRGNAPDYHANENYAPQYGSSPGYRGPNGPPIPAKVPMQINGPPSHTPGSSDPWTLLDEMKNIDLGTGRSRRRQH